MSNHIVVSDSIYVTTNDDTLTDEAIDRIGEAVTDELETALQAVCDLMGKRYPDLIFTLS
jgi:hypothetical protein